MRILVRSLLVLAVCFSLAPLGAAQSDLLQLLGTPPNDPTLNIPMGVVNLRNGNVHLEIPLRTFVERNGLKTEVRYVYDSIAFYTTYSGVPPIYYWVYSSTPIPSGGWRLITSPIDGGVDFLAAQGDASVPCPVGGQSAYTPNTYSNFSFIEPTGTAHPFSFSFDNQNPACAGTDTGGADYSADGMGYYMSVLLPGNGGPLQFQVWDAHGALVCNAITYGPFTGCGMTDTNGNAFGQVNFDDIDELGRKLQPGSGFTIQTQTGSISTNFPGGYNQCCRTSVTNLTGITLPDGRSYQFTYDSGTTSGHYGTLTSMTLPTGAQINFGYTVVAAGLPTVPYLTALTSLTEPGATWNFIYSMPPYGNTTVTAPPDAAGVQNQTFYDFSTNNGARLWLAKYYLGPASGTPLRQIEVDGYQLPTQMITTLENGATSHVVYTYVNVSPPPFYAVPMLASKKEYDFSGALARETVATYQTSAAYTNLHIIDPPTSVKVYGAGGAASGTLLAQTNYTYDSTTLSTTSGSLGNSVLGATSHDDTNYGPSQTIRGNLTSVSQMVSPGNFITTKTNYYNILGELTQTTDGRGNSIFYDYTDKWASGTSSCVPGATYAYPTTITYPATVTDKSVTTYNACDGTTYSTQDQNDVNNSRAGTVYTYDGLQRITNISFPDGGNQQTNYGGSANPQVITKTTAITSSLSMVSSATLDSLGRTTQTALTSDPDCAAGDRTDTTYDGLGRVHTVSNPYCTTSDPTYGLTTYAYDALGRTTQVTHPDNTTVLTTYTGRATQVQDEGNGTQRVTRISQSDGLGRLSSLCEVAPGPFVGAGGSSSSSLIGSAGSPVACGQDIAGTGFLTTYQYDALSDLLQVSQTGIAPRTFTYDSLSRLLSASNPESGAITYAYDANGNLSAKTGPKQNQTNPALTVTTTYQYDALNRLTSKSYSDGTTPAVGFSYDVPNSNWGCGSTTNGVGRLTSTTPWPHCYQYDTMGRMTYKDMRTPPNQLPRMFYAYDLLGNLTSETAGYNTVYYGYNTAARLTSVTSSYSDSQDPAHVFSLAGNGSDTHYNALGRLTSNTLGDNEVETYAYDRRGRLQSYAAALNNTTLYNFNIASFAPNSDILSANDSANGNWTYSYDAFNRLVGSNKNSGQSVFSYVYDRFGNRWQQNGPNSFIATFTGNNPGNPQNNNRMDSVNGSFVYDAAGNMTNDGNNVYTYDAENRITQVNLPGTGGALVATYVYDADGQRVQKTSTVGNSSDPAGTNVLLYNQSGRLVQKMDSSGGVFVQGNIYAGGRHLARVGGWTTFNHSDWLGTERLRTSLNTNPYSYEYCSSLPFGDGLSCTGTDVSAIHFTGKERDAATGLDNFGARFDSSSLGRFMSPDPLAGHTEDPQTLNRYAYVRNNPLNLTDPTGLDFYLSCKPTEDNRPTCHQVEIGDKKFWVQGTTGDNKKFNATVVTSASLQDPNSGNTATVNQSGVQITTANGTSQGVFITGTAAANNIQGSGAFKNFTFDVNGNCSGTCLASGQWHSNLPSYSAVGDLLNQRGAFTIFGEDLKAFLGGGAHPYSFQYRFGGSGCSPTFSCPNSPHLSVPYDYPGTVTFDPRANVPRGGGFHVDEHGDPPHHGWDVYVGQ